MPKPQTKSAIATGVSLGRETYERAFQYHRKIEDFFMRTEGRRPSWSDTLDLLIRAGLEVLEQLDFDEVIEAVARRELPEGVSRIARERKASTLGGLTDEEIEELLRKARRIK